MEIELKRIKKEYFDDVVNKVLDSFHQSGEISCDCGYLATVSEPIVINGEKIVISCDIEKYMLISNDTSTFGYDILSKIADMLHNDLNHNLPLNLCYEKEFWAYLSLSAFMPVVKKLRLDDDAKITDDKIKRFYFNTGTISRTGLMFLWSIVDRLDSENNSEMTKTAFEFIDPVKAIFERTMSKNPLVFRAFVQGIINNGKDNRFKNNVFRLKVPNHISCFAGVNMLDTYDYAELVEIITAEEKAIISAK